MAEGPVRVRAAEARDVEQIHAFIVELAEYERAPEQVTGTPELLREALFGATPSAEALIAEIDDHAAGFALFHGTFSTWECRSGIWLEDLYVPRPSGAGLVWAAFCSAAWRRWPWPGAARVWNGTPWIGTSPR